MKKRLFLLLISLSSALFAAEKADVNNNQNDNVFQQVLEFKEKNLEFWKKQYDLGEFQHKHGTSFVSGLMATSLFLEFGEDLTDNYTALLNKLEKNIINDWPSFLETYKVEIEGKNPLEKALEKVEQKNSFILIIKKRYLTCLIEPASPIEENRKFGAELAAEFDYDMIAVEAIIEGIKKDPMAYMLDFLQKNRDIAQLPHISVQDNQN